MGYLGKLFGRRDKEPSVERRDMVEFPQHKTYFKGGARGRDEYDLHNAFTLGVVQRGDVLEVNALGSVKRLIYMCPDTFRTGSHHFLPEKPYKGMSSNIIFSNVGDWKRVGHCIPEEWNAMMRQLREDEPIHDLE